MSKKKTIFGVWLMLMALTSLTAYTMYFVAQMRFSILLYSYSALVITQLFSLTVFLLGSEKIQHKVVKIIYRLCCLASIAVIPAFLFIFMGLISQYHVDINEAIVVSDSDYKLIVPSNETTIYKTDTFYVFFPEYSHVDLEYGIRPKKSDKSITWCSGAAFQHAIQLGFSDENIEGYHASKGVFSDSPYVKDSYGAVTFSDGNFKFEFDDPKGAIKEAASRGGSGFMQYRILKDGELVNGFNMPRVRSYRVIAELNGNLCIIDSIEMMHFDDFLIKLKELNVENALYMDMGAGWNYSWYRKTTGTPKTLFGLKVPWSHNWVVFRK
ncbi:MAG: hypothetical protein Q4D29_01635 [Lachnospiraceae bacterium]|nr:hypothetical protein [Lachnospiraceae bacterium]